MPNDFLPARGHASSLTLEIEGELSGDDLVRLMQEPGGTHDYVPAVKRLTARHHKAAQLLGEGFTVAEVATICAYTPARLTQLQRDPSFANLMAMFRDQRMVTHLEVGARSRMLMEETHIAAMEEIRDRVADDAKRSAIPIDELRYIAAMTGDRTVAPPKVSQPIVNAPTQITLSFGRDLKPEDAAAAAKDITPATPALEHTSDAEPTTQD